MSPRPAVLLVLFLPLGACATPGGPPPGDAAPAVFAAERAFARTMAERDHDAFAAFLADDAVFFGPEQVLRGRAAVAEGWRPYFDGPTAPFSWEPAQVEVLASGDLALSTGPVHDAAGRCVATFTSIWRREARGAWRVVFDRGTPGCPEPLP